MMKLAMPVNVDLTDPQSYTGYLVFDLPDSVFDFVRQRQYFFRFDTRSDGYTSFLLADMQDDNGSTQGRDLLPNIAERLQFASQCDLLPRCTLTCPPLAGKASKKHLGEN